jgi:hypothetical protein
MKVGTLKCPAISSADEREAAYEMALRRSSSGSGKDRIGCRRGSAHACRGVGSDIVSRL